MLIISQTIFYLVSSVAILVVGVLLVIMIYYLICILRDTRNITDDINNTYHKTKKSIKKIINSITGNKKYEKDK
jgi:predicted PurR-regulated permease PerM